MGSGNKEVVLTCSGSGSGSNPETGERFESTFIAQLRKVRSPLTTGLCGALKPKPGRE